MSASATPHGAVMRRKIKRVMGTIGLGIAYAIVLICLGGIFGMLLWVVVQALHAALYAGWVLK